MTTQDKGSDKINGIIQACRAITKMNQARPNAPKSETLYDQLIANNYNRLHDSQLLQPPAWC